MLPDDERNKCGKFVETNIRRLEARLRELGFGPRGCDKIKPHPGQIAGFVRPVWHDDWDKVAPEERPTFLSRQCRALHLVLYPGFVTAVHCEPHDLNASSLSHLIMWCGKFCRNLDGSGISHTAKEWGWYSDYRLGTILFLSLIRRRADLTFHRFPGVPV